MTLCHCEEEWESQDGLFSPARNTFSSFTASFFWHINATTERFIFTCYMFTIMYWWHNSVRISRSFRPINGPINVTIFDIVPKIKQIQMLQCEMLLAQKHLYWAFCLSFLLFNSRPFSFLNGKGCWWWRGGLFAFRACVLFILQRDRGLAPHDPTGLWPANWSPKHKTVVLAVCSPGFSFFWWHQLSPRSVSDCSFSSDGSGCCLSVMGGGSVNAFELFWT